MHAINVQNVSEALYLGVLRIRNTGNIVQTRAGETLEMPMPVATTYMNPCERVLFYPQRDANPFFHMLESLWMLGGRKDVAWLTPYNKRIAEYSNDGQSFWGAYGYRWRNWFETDQLVTAAYRLKNFKNDRRTVVGIWDPSLDLMDNNESNDIPCNTHIYFKVRDDLLHMTVCCRSNDMIWGAYGANAVHFSFLLEYMAAQVGVGVGRYTQVSDSFHAYTEVLKKLDGLVADYDPYATNNLKHYPLVKDAKRFDMDLSRFLADEKREQMTPYHNPFFHEVADPMRRAWRVWKGGDLIEAISVAKEIQADDWRKACVEWLERRVK